MMHDYIYWIVNLAQDTSTQLYVDNPCFGPELLATDSNAFQRFETEENMESYFVVDQRGRSQVREQRVRDDYA